MITKYPQQQQSLGFLEKPSTQINLQNKHRFSLWSTTISNNKKYLANTSLSKSHHYLDIWDLTQSKSLRKIKFEKIHHCYFIVLQFSLDNKHLVYMYQNEIVLFDLETRSLRSRVNLIEKDVESASISSDFKSYCAIDPGQNSCTIRNIINGTPLVTLQHQFNLSSCLFFNNDRYMITVTYNNVRTQYYIWNLETNKVIKKRYGRYIGKYCDLKMNDEQNLLIVVFQNEEDEPLIQIWSLSTFSVIRTLSKGIIWFSIKQVLGTKIIASSYKDDDEDENKDKSEAKNEKFKQIGQIHLEIFDIITFKLQPITSCINLDEEYNILPNAIITRIRITKEGKLFEIKVFF